MGQFFYGIYHRFYHFIGKDNTIIRFAIYFFIFLFVGIVILARAATEIEKSVTESNRQFKKLFSNEFYSAFTDENIPIMTTYIPKYRNNTRKHLAGAFLIITPTHEVIVGSSEKDISTAGLARYRREKSGSILLFLHEVDFFAPPGELKEWALWLAHNNKIEIANKDTKYVVNVDSVDDFFDSEKDNSRSFYDTIRNYKHEDKEFITIPDFLKLRLSLPSKHDYVGVYILHNTTKNKYYVGQSKRIFNRVNQHITGSGNGDVYVDVVLGDSFIVRLIEHDERICTLNALEKHYIETYCLVDSYNKTMGNSG